MASSCQIAARAPDEPASKLAALEKHSGGRLGVWASVVGGGKNISYRAGERFLMCSTFKVLAVAAVLARVDRGEEHLNRHVTYTRNDLLPYAPMTRQHVAQGFMTVGGLCEAAIEYSDNTAANVLLKTLGGPAGVTAYVRTLGDPVTSLNRTEPALNTEIPGSIFDTTTPAAMAGDVRDLIFGDALRPASRSDLTSWLRGCQTGQTCIRAGLPPSWIVGDKTGTGGKMNAEGASDTRNDVAVAWPPKGPPLVIAVYLTGVQLPAAPRDGVLADAARIVAGEFEHK